MQRPVIFAIYRDGIINPVQNIEKKEIANHPLERILTIEERSGCTLVTTTGIHAARGIGSALFSAFNGELSTQNSSESAGPPLPDQMKENSSAFRVYEELNRLSPLNRKNGGYTLRIKATIAAQGAPHTEVELIVVNG